MYSFKINSESQTVVECRVSKSSLLRAVAGQAMSLSPDAETSTSVDNVLQCLITFTNLKNKTKPLVGKKILLELVRF